VHVSALYGRDRPVVSFEFFPPKTADGETALVRTIEALRALQPGFVTVTRTGARPREVSVELAARIKALGIESAAHVTCIEASREELRRHFDLMTARGIDNVVAIRGDAAHLHGRSAPVDGFRWAVDMIRFIREGGWPLCIAGAGHPEGHPECRDLDRGMAYLREKVEAGLEVVITQLFFDNATYFAFVERAQRYGIHVPIVAGIMPITNVAQIRRMVELSGNAIPKLLEAQLVASQDDPARTLAVGVEWATQQCIELLERGAPGLHFYTLNQSPATRAIFENLRARGLVGAVGEQG